MPRIRDLSPGDLAPVEERLSGPVEAWVPISDGAPFLMRQGDLDRLRDPQCRYPGAVTASSRRKGMSAETAWEGFRNFVSRLR